jgi:hypothetical protein
LTSSLYDKETDREILYVGLSKDDKEEEFPNRK